MPASKLRGTLVSGRNLITRRRLITGAGAAAVSGPLIVIAGKARAAKDTVVAATWGGTFAEAQVEAFHKPFEKETGIKVIAAGPPDLAKIKAQVATGTVDIDMADLQTGIIVPGEQAGVWAEIDRNIVNLEGVIPEAIRAHEVAYMNYAGGVAFDKDRFPDGKHPTNWPEFWDAKKFPGRRGLRTKVSEMLEIALMADGVDPKKVYPIDIERAFKSLDRIKPNVSNFIAETPQTISLIQNNECDFTYAYHGRVYGAMKGGLPIGFSFKQNFLALGWLAAIKNSPNPEGAQRLIASMFIPERQAHFANLAAYSGTNRASAALVKDDVKPYLPKADAPDACIENIDWWAGHFEELQTRYKEWLIS